VLFCLAVWVPATMNVVGALLLIANDGLERPVHHCFVTLTERVSALGNKVEALMEQQEKQKQNLQ